MASFIKIKKLNVSFGFIAVILIFALKDRNGIMPMFVFASLLHELGHLSVIFFQGRKIKEIRLIFAGAEIDSEPENTGICGTLTEAAAGVVANLAAAFISNAILTQVRSESIEIFAAANIVTALYNLVPAGRMDGGRLTEEILMHFFGVERGENIWLVIDLVVSASLCAVAICMFVLSENNISLGVIFLYTMLKLKEKNRKDFFTDVSVPN